MPLILLANFTHFSEKTYLALHPYGASHVVGEANALVTFVNYPLLFRLP